MHLQYLQPLNRGEREKKKEKEKREREWRGGDQKRKEIACVCALIITFNAEREG